MSLRLDIFVKKKEVKGNVLDKRKYRQAKSGEQRLIDKLSLEIDMMGVANRDRVLRDLIKVKNYQNLNFTLLILVYLYFGEKNFDIGNVVLNFDKDFEEQVKKIKEKDYFNLDKKDSLYNFRQDFIIYLLLINNSDRNIDGPESQDMIEEGDYVPEVEEEDINYEALNDMAREEGDYDDDYFIDLLY
jgi:hypothetical protein